MEFIEKNIAEINDFIDSENKIEFYGNFRFLGYNAPYQFINRRNEIIVNVNWEVNK